VVNVIARRDNGVFLAAGEADERGGFGREARLYLCEAEKSGGEGAYAIRWERGPQDVDPAFGPALSAYYDAEREVYRVLGGHLEYDDRRNRIPASYVIELDGTGAFTKPALAVKGAVLTKIIGDAVGNVYLAGEAVGADRSAALLLKYSREGAAVWKSQTPLPRNSYYQDALFDEDENQIVLAGVLNGESGRGDGGTPFIQGIDAETGKEIWRSTLSAAPFRKTALAYRIEKAAWGYRVVLCGVSGTGPVPPYIEAAVNARGRFID
jgi:hypothetical protein